MSNIESPRRVTTGSILVVSALMEIGAGLVLIAAPATAIALVFDLPGMEAAVVIARLAGAALLSIGAACWLARHDGGSAAGRALVIGLLTYNAAIVALVVSFSLGPPGPLLWAIAALHGAMAIWCLSSLRSAAVTRNAIAIALAALSVAGSASAAAPVTGAAIPAQTPQSFTLAVPLQVDIMTNVRFAKRGAL